MKRFLYLAIVPAIMAVSCAEGGKTHSGNPIADGWYADPEAIIYGDEYWIFPTLSDLDDYSEVPDIRTRPSTSHTTCRGISMHSLQKTW